MGPGMMDEYAIVRRIHPSSPPLSPLISIYAFSIDERAALAFSTLAWLVLAMAYTMPAMPPTPMAETLPMLAGSPKKRIPEAATGSLLSARVRLGDGSHKLVQSADHRVRGRAASAHTPSSRVRDEDGDRTGEGDGEQEETTVGLGEVTGKRGASPVLDKEREDEQDRNGQEVVVEHRVPVLEAGDLDALAHEEDLKSVKNMR